MRISGLFLAIICALNISAQSVEELYESGDYVALTRHADEVDSLEAFECYCVGYAFFQLKQDEKAIKMYNKAIEKGLDEDYIYLYKGLAQRYTEQYDSAIKSLRKAIELNPMGQKNYAEMGFTFYSMKQQDSALYYFEKGRNLPFELGSPYFMVPVIYHEQGKFDKALEEYHQSSLTIDKSDAYYQDILENIGLLEYAHAKNYHKAAEAYQKIIQLQEGKYSKYYEKLVKAYIANESYDKADAWIAKMTKGYQDKELPEEYMTYKAMVIDQFEWNGYRVNAQKYFEPPTEFADPIYKFFIIDDEKGEVIKTIHTEKTIAGISDVKHMVCEWRDGTHINYGYGFVTEEIPYEQMKMTIMEILNNDAQPAATSSSGKSKRKKRSKKKKKKKS